MFRPLSMKEITITGLAELPRWALVAFAARCARRLDRSSTIFLDPQGQLASANAIRLTERSAAMARALDVDAAIQATEEARQRTCSEVYSRGDDSDYASEFSAPAQVATLAAAIVKEPDPHKVGLIIDEVHYDLGDSVKPGILSDYKLLAQVAVEQRWSDSTAIAPHFFAVAKNGASLVLQVVRWMSDKLSQLVADDPGALDAIEWRDLERLLAGVFDGLGFDVDLTPASKDGGKDIVLQYWHEGWRKEYIVEIKHWRSGKRVGKKHLTDFVKVVAREKRDGGLFLATYGYVENEIEVISEVERDRVFLGEKSHIVSLCRSYERRNNGLWTPAAPLHELLPREFRPLETTSRAGHLASNSMSQVGPTPFNLHS